MNKTYRSIPIMESGEPMALLPQGIFAFSDPHPYQAAGAPYGKASPWQLRSGVLAALLRAQAALSALKPGWKIKFFDAYRPNAVQAFMVEREYQLLAAQAGFDPAALTPDQRTSLTPGVLRIWAIPSDDPTTPPPHSTGAALDITLQDESGNEVVMGGAFDENSPRSTPDHYAQDPSPQGRLAHQNRLILAEIMQAQGFHRHHDEWWHFSQGDQLWAWYERQRQGIETVNAIYGRAEPV